MDLLVDTQGLLPAGSPPPHPPPLAVTTVSPISLRPLLRCFFVCRERGQEIAHGGRGECKKLGVGVKTVGRAARAAPPATAPRVPWCVRAAARGLQRGAGGTARCLLAASPVARGVLRCWWHGVAFAARRFAARCSVCSTCTVVAAHCGVCSTARWLQRACMGTRLGHLTRSDQRDSPSLMTSRPS